MFRGEGQATSRSGGYTIVEALIFLAVSALLFTSTMLFLAGRQNRAQFTNAVRDFETQILDIANDTSTGFFQSSPNVVCDPSGNPIETGTPRDAGTDQRCIFLGRVIKLSNDGNREQFVLYSVVGNRLNGSNADVSTLAEANPKLLLTGGASDAQLRRIVPFGYGMRIACIATGDSCTPGNSSSAALAFMTRLTGGVAPEKTGSAITAEVYHYPSVALDSNESLVRAQVVGGTQTRLNGRITMCMQSGTTNQYALISIGTADGGNATVSSSVREGNTCAA